MKIKKKKQGGAGSHALAVVRKFFPNVDKVSDATGTVDVSVTAADDKASRKKDHAECAMAMACKREMKLDGVIVSRKTAYLIKGGTATRYELPESTSREVVSFDRGSGFAPGDYHLRPPSESRRLGAITGGGGPTKTTRKIRRVHHTAGIRAVLGSKKI